MIRKIDIQDVQLSWLSPRCMTLISRYVKRLYELERVVMAMQADDTISKIASHAKRTQDADLRAIYTMLKIEIKVCLQQPSLEREVLKKTVPASLVNEVSQPIFV